MRSKSSRSQLFVTLGYLVAFSPLITDTYLPCLPAMVTYFKTVPSMIQMSLMSSMVGLALGQILVGSLSDKYGRRKPLLISIVLFLISTVGCIFSWNVESFIILRLIQGMAAAGGVVISRAVSVDLFRGKTLAKVLGMIAAIMGIAPIAAPLLGGILQNFSDWRGIFIFLFIMGLVLFFLCYKLEESHPFKRRHKASVFSLLLLYKPALANKCFMLYVLSVSASMGVMFAYISSSPFILQQEYHISPFLYSICFALNAVGIFIGSFLATNHIFKKTEHAALTGVIGLFVVSVLVSIILVSHAGFLPLEVALFLLLCFCGLCFPSISTLALDLARKNSGTAAAILGSLNFMAGGVVSPLVGIGDIAKSSAIAMSVLSFCALALLLVTRIKPVRLA